MTSFLPVKKDIAGIGSLHPAESLKKFGFSAYRLSRIQQELVDGEELIPVLDLGVIGSAHMQSEYGIIVLLQIKRQTSPGTIFLAAVQGGEEKIAVLLVIGPRGGKYAVREGKTFRQVPGKAFRIIHISMDSVRHKGTTPFTGNWEARQRIPELSGH